jgi:oligoendopeptidase F
MFNKYIIDPFLEVINHSGDKHSFCIADKFYTYLDFAKNISKIRNFSGFLEGELFDDNIPLELYDGLISEVKKNIKLLHRSMKLRKNIFIWQKSITLI